MNNWNRIRQNVTDLNLDFSHDSLKITNAEFLSCIDVLQQHIPDGRLDQKQTPGNFDFIRGWTDQLLRATERQSLAAVAVLTALAHAYEAIAGLPGAQCLVRELPKHESRGLFDQLLITYYLTQYINVTSVE